MVRTLVFQSNNVGSIPTGPILYNVHNHYNFLKEGVFDSKLNPSMLYRFRFVSLIPPYLLSDLRLFNVTSSPSTVRKSTSLMKQSYLLFTWFFYLKESTLGLSRRSSKNIKFAFLPTRRKVYTLIKAPMAHKTNSKEQIQFRFFKFSISIRTFFNTLQNPTNLNSGLHLHLLLKKRFPVFETNLLILKSYEIWLSLSDETFFNLSKFSIKN